MDFIEQKKKLKKEIDKDRYEHTLGVMYTSACLAMKYQYSVEKAMIAGLLHDCAKCISNDNKIKLCKKNGIEISEIEKINPCLLHAKVGSLVAHKDYKVDDDEILSAITFHTTGKPNMTLLEKIIYVADYIEPNRDKADNLDFLRQVAFEDINQCVAYIARDTLNYLKKKNSNIDLKSEETYKYYEKYINR